MKYENLSNRTEIRNIQQRGNQGWERPLFSESVMLVNDRMKHLLSQLLSVWIFFLYSLPTSLYFWWKRTLGKKAQNDSRAHSVFVDQFSDNGWFSFMCISYPQMRCLRYERTDGCRNRVLRESNCLHEEKDWHVPVMGAWNLMFEH